MIRADIETVVSPIVGTEKQSEELMHDLLNEFEENPTKIWESNIFGKSLHELVNDGLHNKSTAKEFNPLPSMQCVDKPIDTPADFEKGRYILSK